MENHHLEWIFPFEIVFFHSYVKLPEGMEKQIQCLMLFSCDACLVWTSMVGTAGTAANCCQKPTHLDQIISDCGAAEVGTDAIGTFGAIHTFILVLATFAIQVVPCLEGGSGMCR